MDTWLLEFWFNKKVLNDHAIADQFIGNIGELLSTVGQVRLVFEDRNTLENSGFTLLYQRPSECTILIQGSTSGLLTIDLNAAKDSGICKQKITDIRCKILQLENIYQRKTLEFSSLPAIKRGQKFSAYDTTSSNNLIEYDYDKLVFDEDSEYQNVRIFHSLQFGNCLVLDNDMNLSESDLAYTVAITGSGKENYEGKDVLILGGGDGGILSYLRRSCNGKPKMITMIDIDDVVMKAAKLYLRGICGDALDDYDGDNYKVVVGDCVEYLKEYVKEGHQFDYVINDLTAIPVSTNPVGSHWDFLRLILSLSMEVLKEDGKYFTQGNGANNTLALATYEEQLKKLKYPVSFSKETVCVPSYLELWIFYTIWKTGC